MDENKSQKNFLETPEEEADSPEEVVEITGTSAKEAVKEAKKAEKAGAESVDIDGEKVEPIILTKELLNTINDIRSILSDKGVHVSIDDLTIQELSGKQIGLSTAEGVLLDPKALSEPMVRMGVLMQALGHEYLHKDGKIKNEALVTAMAAAFFPAEMELPEKYEECKNYFNELAEKFDSNKDLKTNMTTIYLLYSAGINGNRKAYGQIFETYRENHVDKLKTEEERDEAVNLFYRAFPELKFTDDGQLNLARTLDHTIERYNHSPEAGLDKENKGGVASPSSKLNPEDMQKLTHDDIQEFLPYQSS